MKKLFALLLVLVLVAALGTGLAEEKKFIIACPSATWANPGASP